MIICGLSSGQTNLHPPIWGHGRQLDDRHRHPNINIREIIWLGNQLEVIQSYLRIWGTCDPIESGPSDPKKWGLYRRSVKKCRFSGQNRAPAAAPRPAVQRGQYKNVVFLLSGHDGNKKVGRFCKKMDFGPKKTVFLARNSAFFYATPMKLPFFVAQTDLIQWDHKSPIS